MLEKTLTDQKLICISLLKKVLMHDEKSFTCFISKMFERRYKVALFLGEESKDAITKVLKENGLIEEGGENLSIILKKTGCYDVFEFIKIAQRNFHIVKYTQTLLIDEPSIIRQINNYNDKLCLTFNNAFQKRESCTLWEKRIPLVEKKFKEANGEIEEQAYAYALEAQMRISEQQEQKIKCLQSQLEGMDSELKHHVLVKKGLEDFISSQQKEIRKLTYILEKRTQNKGLFSVPQNSHAQPLIIGQFSIIPSDKDARNASATTTSIIEAHIQSNGSFTNAIAGLKRKVIGQKQPSPPYNNKRLCSKEDSSSVNPQPASKAPRNFRELALACKEKIEQHNSAEKINGTSSLHYFNR